ncbi:MAG TPA: alpha/beta fold hydrolase [Chryseosolibacter sp.]|jgi:pimeloyl-ACP methyl ester carboxylesterase|nr:alpha/beta fold hydrolase [Chryseosolibacter sp.]
MKLFHRESGQGQPMILLHGIFGSSDNWLTPAKLLSSQFHTFALDLRNHGQSPHEESFNYPVMAADVLEFIEANKITNPVIVGHSMGGKVAMNFALAYPDKLQKLIVVDIAPKEYNMKHYVILEGLNGIPIEQVTTRAEADEILARYVPEADVRQFLLKNLQRKAQGGFKWKLNLVAIDANIERIGLDLEFPGPFNKPTLFVRGARSNYIRDEDVARIKEVFPMAQLETLDTGHWVPAEKPKEFVELVEQWLRS